MKIFLIGYMFLFIYDLFEIYKILADIRIERIWMLQPYVIFCFLIKQSNKKYMV